MLNEASEAGSGNVAGMFDQAFQAFADSCKVAMKAQEDTVRFWTDAAGKANPLRTMGSDLIPTAQKNTDEYLRLLEAGYRRNADMVKKVMHGQNADGATGFEKRAGDLLEASLAVAQENARDLASTNLRVAQAWTDVAKKGAQQCAQAAEPAVPAGK